MLGLVTVALVGKRARAELGGEWPVVNFIVEAMAKANKCRTADDLLMSTELHPRLPRCLTRGPNCRMTNFARSCCVPRTCTSARWRCGFRLARIDGRRVI